MWVSIKKIDLRSTDFMWWAHTSILLSTSYFIKMIPHYVLMIRWAFSREISFSPVKGKSDTQALGLITFTLTKNPIVIPFFCLKHSTSRKQKKHPPLIYSHTLCNTQNVNISNPTHVHVLHACTKRILYKLRVCCSFSVLIFETWWNILTWIFVAV